MLVVLLFATVFLLGSLRIGKDEHDRYASALTSAARLAGELQNAVLGIQSGVANDYDTITGLQREVTQLVPVFESRPDMQSLADSIRRKVDLVEQFKSQHAIYRNSLHALPVLHDELRRTTEYARLDPKLDVLLTGVELSVFRDTFIYEDSGKPLVLDSLEALQAQREFAALSKITEWNLLAAHVDKLIEVTPKKVQLFEAIQSVPLIRLIRPARMVIESEYEYRLARSKLFQMGSFVLSIVLLLIVIQMVFAIWKNNRQLEVRVAKRTQELADLNSELRQEIEYKTKIQEELVQAQKLEAIGQLSAGIAHEINTPTQYVGDNIRFLQDSFGDVMTVVNRVSEHANDDAGLTPEEVREYINDADVGFLAEEIPRAISESVEGIDRVTNIVRALKEFSHPSKDMVPEDLNRAIQSTTTVAMNEWKYVAELELDLDTDLPPVPCVLSEFNQVVLNLVVNASHAIADIVGDRSEKGKITIRTRHLDSSVAIQIHDTGGGIPQEIRDRVFEPFFTTKDVGKGTGQGLSIAHNVIVDKHGGSLTIDNDVECGTQFTITLPLAEHDAESPRAIAS